MTFTESQTSQRAARQRLRLLERIGQAVGVHRWPSTVTLMMSTPWYF